MSRPVKTEMVTSLIEGTNKRVKLLKELPQHLDYNWQVEKKNMLLEWETFYEEFSPKLNKMKKTDIFGIGDEYFNKATYFIYFFGSFFKHNGDDNDQAYVRVCYAYLYEEVGFIDGQEYDIAGLFYKAFPKKK